MNDLASHIQSYFGIPDADLDVISSLFKPESYKHGDLLIEKGKRATKLSFIQSGYFRIYNYSDKKEITQWVSSPNEFVTDLASMMFGEASHWNIECISDAKVYSISKADYDNLNKLIPEWSHIEKLFLGKCFRQIEHRVYSFLSMTAEERYLYFEQTQSELFQIVPLQNIASMLGMTPETLSRIRKKVVS